MAIDTLGYVKKLEAAGMDRRLAEVQAEAMNEWVVPQLATSKDLHLLRTELTGEVRLMRGEMHQLEERLDGKMSRLESKVENLLWKHTVAIILAVVAVGGFLMRFTN